MYNADDAMNTLRCMPLSFQFILFIYLSISYIIMIITDYRNAKARDLNGKEQVV